MSKPYDTTETISTTDSSVQEKTDYGTTDISNNAESSYNENSAKT